MGKIAFATKGKKKKSESGPLRRPGLCRYSVFKDIILKKKWGKKALFNQLPLFSPHPHAVLVAFLEKWYLFYFVLNQNFTLVWALGFLAGEEMLRGSGKEGWEPGKGSAEGAVQEPDLPELGFWGSPPPLPPPHPGKNQQWRSWEAQVQLRREQSSGWGCGFAGGREGRGIPLPKNPSSSCSPPPPHSRLVPRLALGGDAPQKELDVTNASL